MNLVVRTKVFLLFRFHSLTVDIGSLAKPVGGSRNPSWKLDLMFTAYLFTVSSCARVQASSGVATNAHNFQITYWLSVKQFFFCRHLVCVQGGCSMGSLSPQ